MARYVIVIERARHNFSAYAPDLPGCVATGRTRREARRRMEEAMRFHFEGLRADGLVAPRPSTMVAEVEYPKRRGRRPRRAA